MKAMASGLGFEGEAPGILLIRTGIFGFLLLASKQIFQIGIGMTGKVMDMISIPGSVTLTTERNSRGQKRHTAYFKYLRGGEYPGVA